MFSNYVTLRRHVRRDERGSERIASRQGGLTNFHATESEQLAIGARVWLWGRFRYTRYVPTWGVHAPCFREGPLSVSASRDYHLLRKAAREEREADSHGKRRNIVSPMRSPESAVVILKTGWNVELRRILINVSDAFRTKSPHPRRWWSKKTELSTPLCYQYWRLFSTRFRSRTGSCGRYPVEIIFPGRSGNVIANEDVFADKNVIEGYSKRDNDSYCKNI